MRLRQLPTDRNLLQALSDLLTRRLSDLGIGIIGLREGPAAYARSRSGLPLALIQVVSVVASMRRCRADRCRPGGPGPGASLNLRSRVSFQLGRSHKRSSVAAPHPLELPVRRSVVPVAWSRSLRDPVSASAACR